MPTHVSGKDFPRLGFTVDLSLLINENKFQGKCYVAANLSREEVNNIARGDG